MSSHASHNYTDPNLPPRPCQNCGTALRGPYCSHCGQHDIEYHRSFHHLTHDLLENLFHFDGKFLVSVAWMMAKPGRLTAEFNAGRRASQVPPLRFYIFVTVLFFLGVHLLNHGHLFSYDRKAADQVNNTVRNAVTKYQLPADFSPEEKALFRKEATNAIANEPAEFNEKVWRDVIEKVRPGYNAGAPVTNPNFSRRGPNITVSENSEMGKAFKEKVMSGEITLPQFLDELETRVPTLLFLGMPVFALLLKILYVRNKRYYVEHLIFSVHLHTWAFIALMVGSGYIQLAGFGPNWLVGLVVAAFVGWGLWYIFTAFRTVYGQSRVKTALKMALSFFAYAFAALLLMTAGIYLSVIRLVYFG